MGDERTDRVADAIEGARHAIESSRLSDVEKRRLHDRLARMAPRGPVATPADYVGCCKRCLDKLVADLANCPPGDPDDAMSEYFACMAVCAFELPPAKPTVLPGDPHGGIEWPEKPPRGWPPGAEWPPRVVYGTPSVTPTTPTLPAATERACRIRVDLLRISYGGEGVGTDWKFGVIVQGRDQRYDQQTLALNSTRVIARTLLDTTSGKCGENVPIDFVCMATEVDTVVDDNGQTAVVKTYACPSHVIDTIDVTVRSGVATATMTFAFEITLSCE